VEERNAGGVEQASRGSASGGELESLRAAFGRGDFAETRRLAAKLAAQADLSDETRAEATRLLRATATDPLAVYIGLGSLLFFLGVVYFTLFR
jgi:hypothetical protein